MTRGFRIYLGVMVFIIAALLVILTGSLLYGAIKVKDEAGKVTSFSRQADTIHQDLQSISQQLQSQANAYRSSSGY